VSEIFISARIVYRTTKSFDQGEAELEFEVEAMGKFSDEIEDIYNREEPILGSSSPSSNSESWVVEEIHDQSISLTHGRLRVLRVRDLYERLQSKRKVLSRSSRTTDQRGCSPSITITFRRPPARSTDLQDDLFWRRIQRKLQPAQKAALLGSGDIWKYPKRRRSF